MVKDESQDIAEVFTMKNGKIKDKKTIPANGELQIPGVLKKIDANSSVLIPYLKGFKIVFEAVQ